MMYTNFPYFNPDNLQSNLGHIPVLLINPVECFTTYTSFCRLYTDKSENIHLCSQEKSRNFPTPTKKGYLMGVADTQQQGLL